VGKRRKPYKDEYHRGRKQAIDEIMMLKWNRTV
jgi:hypothetical protein